MVNWRNIAIALIDPIEGVSSANACSRQLNRDALILDAQRHYAMNLALLKALVALFPASLLLSGSTIMFLRGKTLYLLVQLFGAGCILIVVLTHVCEELHLFPNMQWGLEHSAGHYVDLGGAVLALTLFPAGYLLHALSSK